MSKMLLVVIGASTGGVEALRTVCAGLPEGLPAAVLVVLHVDSHPSILPRVLARGCLLPVSHAVHGEPLRAGRVYVAPPDLHMTVDEGGIVLSRGAKEHHTRPAVDPLFRSAAEHHGVRTMGVILTGDLNDGTEGLDRIRRAGGRTLAQDPREAVAPGMPQHAVLRGAADEVAILADIPARVVTWCKSLPGVAVAQDLPPIAIPAPNGAASPGDDDRTVFVCPTCKGSLRRTGELPDGFACYTGHRFTLQTLGWAQNLQTDEALWTAYRALCEKSFLNWLLVEEARSLGNDGDAARHEERASESERLAAIVRAVASRAGGTLAVPER